MTASASRPRHIPVLLTEVLATLRPQAGERFIDATFGAGGYSCAILDAAETHVWALDRDPQAIAAGAALVDQYAPRLELTRMPFGDLFDVAAGLGPHAPHVLDGSPSPPRGGVRGGGLHGTGQAGAHPAFDGLVLDLGVSSMQLDDAGRGFSFRADGPLDMRMSSGADGTPSAADVVNTASERQIADILYNLGEERRSRAIAAAIVRRRAERLFTRTLELADLVASVLGRRHDDDRHPATRTFQALRLYVNDELGQLARALIASEHLLAPGGRLVVVTFHSLEDRIVKRFLTDRTGRTPRASRHLPNAPAARPQSFQIINPKPLLPSPDEVAANPRARSAKLRAATRTQAPAAPVDERAIDALVPFRPEHT